MKRMSLRRTFIHLGISTHVQLQRKNSLSLCVRLQNSINLLNHKLFCQSESPVVDLNHSIDLNHKRSISVLGNYMIHWVTLLLHLPPADSVTWPRCWCVSEENQPCVGQFMNFGNDYYTQSAVSLLVTTISVCDMLIERCNFAKLLGMSQSIYNTAKSL